MGPNWWLWPHEDCLPGTADATRSERGSCGAVLHLVDSYDLFDWQISAVLFFAFEKAGPSSLFFCGGRCAIAISGGLQHTFLAVDLFLSMWYCIHS